jgi:hypothetical protein
MRTNTNLNSMCVVQAVANRLVVFSLSVDTHCDYSAGLCEGRGGAGRHGPILTSLFERFVFCAPEAFAPPY